MDLGKIGQVLWSKTSQLSMYEKLQNLIEVSTAATVVDWVAYRVNKHLVFAFVEAQEAQKANLKQPRVQYMKQLTGRIFMLSNAQLTRKSLCACI